MALKKTKTTGKGSQSFMREIDKSEFVLGEDRQDDLRFLMTQPERSEKLLKYFLHTGLKYKEVFDAINIGDLGVAKQVAHLKNIADLLREHGWQGKVDLHTRPVGQYDHPSPHIHLWGSQVTKEVYELVKNYLLDNDLTYADRLKSMKMAKVIQKISREDLKIAAKAEKKSDEPTEFTVRRKKSIPDKRIEEFVVKSRLIDPKIAATIDRINAKKSQLKEKIDALKKSISGKENPVVITLSSRQKAVDNKFKVSEKALRDLIKKIKTDLTTNI